MASIWVRDSADRIARAWQTATAVAEHRRQLARTAWDQTTGGGTAGVPTLDQARADAVRDLLSSPEGLPRPCSHTQPTGHTQLDDHTQPDDTAQPLHHTKPDDGAAPNDDDAHSITPVRITVLPCRCRRSGPSAARFATTDIDAPDAGDPRGSPDPRGSRASHESTLSWSTIAGQVGGHLDLSAPLGADTAHDVAPPF